MEPTTINLAMKAQADMETIRQFVRKSGREVADNDHGFVIRTALDFMARAVREEEEK